MLLKKKGLPEEGDLLLCKVTNIQYNSVFCALEEYENKSGMIHISEVSAGRIKNIREFVTEGKIIVCKVLSVNKERGYIDLSLRRVNKGQHRTKVDEIRQEQRAEKLLEFFCIQTKRNIKDVYLHVSTVLLQYFSYIFQAFDEVVKKDVSLTQWGIPADIADTLGKIIKENIKAKALEIKGILTLSSYASDGVGVIKTTLAAAQAISPLLTITYSGGGKYNFIVVSQSFKQAEKIMKDASETAIAVGKKAKADVEFKRIEAA